ncbi:MAG: response regulator [Caldilineaceae bacterium]|nr:response regulator [Caldilineaceae bacterium]
MLDQPFHILLVEDDDVDAEVVIRAFRRNAINNSFTIVPNGIDALNSLRGAEGLPRLPRPFVILLDINMPRMNGIEFLHALRQDVTLKRSIVFVLTTSNSDEDKMAAYDEQIAGYLLKSQAGDDFMNVIRLLDSYQAAVEFPPEVA